MKSKVIQFRCLLILVIILTFLLLSNTDFWLSQFADNQHPQEVQSDHLMTERLRSINRYCATNSFDQKKAVNIKHFVIEERAKVIYCFLQKVASTTWLTVLAETSGNQKFIETKQKFRYKYFEAQIS